VPGGRSSSSIFAGAVLGESSLSVSWDICETASGFKFSRSVTTSAGCGFSSSMRLRFGRGDLERVEQEAGGFAFEPLLQDHLHDLANDGLNGVRIFKGRQVDFAGRVRSVGVAFGGDGTILLMVETKTFLAESGRTALGSVDLDMLGRGVARPIAKRRAGMFRRRCQFSKGGMLTFAYRSKFFANSYFRASRPTFFHHTFPVPSSRTRNPNRAIIHRQYSIENWVRLQRPTHNSPQNIFGGSLTKGRQVHK
jgi:hypothetical protein